MKITMNQYREMLNMKKKPTIIQRMLSYRLEYQGDCRYRVKCFMPWWLYLILFIPAHALEALLLMWDGGLKEFEICARQLADWPLYPDCGARYNTAKEIWEKA